MPPITFHTPVTEQKTYKSTKLFNFQFFNTTTHLIWNRIREFGIEYPSINSRDSSVGIALVYGLDDRGSRVRFPAEAWKFSLRHRIQNGSGAHPAFHPMVFRGTFPWGKAART
jgi:hypothetical protein